MEIDWLKFRRAVSFCYQYNTSSSIPIIRSLFCIFCNHFIYVTNTYLEECIEKGIDYTTEEFLDQLQMAVVKSFEESRTADDLKGMEDHIKIIIDVLDDRKLRINLYWHLNLRKWLDISCDQIYPMDHDKLQETFDVYRKEMLVI